MDNLPYEKVGKNEPVCIADEVPFEIPDSWEWIRLGGLAYNHGQKTPEKDFSYIDIGSIDNANQTLNEKETIISPQNAPSRARKIIIRGDILYSTVRPYLHNMCIVDKSFSCEPIASTGFAVVSCHADFYPGFLFYYMMSPAFDSYANDTENSKGVAYPAINDDRLYKALIPVPPVAEQHRIIQKYLSIDPYIKKYDCVEVNLSLLNDNFAELLKKSILQQAVMGKLAPQDPSDEPASVLLERIRIEKEKLVKAGKLKKDKNESVIYRRDNSHYEKIDGVETCIDDEIPFEIPDTWEWSRAYSIGSMIRGKGIKRTETVTKGVPCVRYGEIYTSYNVSFSDAISFIDKSLDDSCLHFSNGDIIFTLTGENKVDIAKAVAYLGKDKVAAGGDLAYWTAHGMNPLYLVYYMASPYCIERKRRTATGDIIVHISTGKVGTFLIPIPPLSEQERIVEAINTAFTMLSAL